LFYENLKELPLNSLLIVNLYLNLILKNPNLKKIKKIEKIEKSGGKIKRKRRKKGYL